MFLTYASVMDKRTGYVSNRFWLAAITGAALSTVCDCILSEQLRLLMGTGLSFVLTTTLALAMFRIGLFGGADAKALIALSLFIPTASPYLHSPEVPLITSLSTLVNLLALLGLILCVNAFRNVYFICYKHESLMGARSPRECGLLVLFGYKRLHPNNRTHRKAGKFGEGRTEFDPCASMVTERKSGPSCLESDGSMEPMKIPLIPVITLSLLFSLLLGDISIVFMA
jgi:Flp pilus assembly protein protease CpaA